MESKMIKLIIICLLWQQFTCDDYDILDTWAFQPFLPPIGRWITEQQAVMKPLKYCQVDGDIFDKCGITWTKARPLLWNKADLNPLHYVTEHKDENWSWMSIHLLNIFMKRDFLKLWPKRMWKSEADLLREFPTGPPYIVFNFTQPFCGVPIKAGRKADQRKHEIYLTKGCGTFQAAVHMLMHVMGFGHEIRRPDRDNYVHVFLQNVPEDLKIQYEIQPFPDGANNTHPFDSKSIMQYAVNEYQLDPTMPVIVPLVHEVSPFDFQHQFYFQTVYLEKDHHFVTLSKSDAEKLNHAYEYVRL